MTQLPLRDCLAALTPRGSSDAEILICTQTPLQAEE